MIWPSLFVVLIAFAAIMLGGWVVYRLRYSSTRSRTYVVLVEPLRQDGEEWWAAHLDDETGGVFMSRSQSRAVAYALEWKAGELRRSVTP